MGEEKPDLTELEAGSTTILDISGMPDDLMLPGIFWATDAANDLIMDAGGDLSEDEVRQSPRFRRGEGLLCIGYNHVPVQFLAA